MFKKSIINNGNLRENFNLNTNEKLENIGKNNNAKNSGRDLYK